jgi:uncharacterized protein DUF6152
MKPQHLVFFALIVGLPIVCGPAFAHHGAATYVDRIIVLKEATVTKFLWSNPHIIVLLDVKDDKGNVTHWAAEAGNPSVLSQVGWRKTSLQPGDVIRVFLYPARSGNPVGRIQKVMLADGTTLRDSPLG